MLVLSRGPEEGIMIGAEVEVRVLEVRGDRVRLGIVAPSRVPIHRTEVFLSIRKENEAAASAEALGLEKAVELLGRSGAGGVPGSPPHDRGPLDRSGEARKRKVIG